MAQVSPAGTVCFFTNTDIDLVVDVVGYVSPGDRTGSHPAPRSASPTPVTSPGPRSMPARQGIASPPARRWSCQIAGVRGVPAAARAISANLTVVDANDRGFVTAWPVRRGAHRVERQLRTRDGGCQRGRAAAVGVRRDLHLLLELRARHHRRQRLVELSQTRYGSMVSASIP